MIGALTWAAHGHVERAQGVLVLALEVRVVTAWVTQVSHPDYWTRDDWVINENQDPGVLADVLGGVFSRGPTWDWAPG